MSFFVMPKGHYNSADWNTATWAKLVHEYEARLTTLQKELEGDLDEVKTAKVRGRISEVRRLLKLPEEIRVVEVQAGEY